MSQKQITDFFKRKKSKKIKPRKFLKNCKGDDSNVRLVSITMPIFDNETDKYNSDCSYVIIIPSSTDNSELDESEPEVMAEDKRCASQDCSVASKISAKENGRNFTTQNDESVEIGNVENHSQLNDYYTSFFSEMVGRFNKDTSLHDLFDVKEKEAIFEYSRLPCEHSKILFCRMYWLIHKWCRVAKVVSSYLKCSDEKNPIVKLAISTLIKTGLLINGKDHMTLIDWIDVLNNNDLMKICKHYKILPTSKGDKPKRDKASLVEAINALCSCKTTITSIFSKNSTSMESKVLKWVSSQFGDYIKISADAKSTFDKLHILMYLGMNPAVLREKKLCFTLTNIKYGKQSYPPMFFDHIDSPSAVFPSRQHFNEYFRAYNLFEEVLSLSLLKNTPANNQEIMKLCMKCLTSFKQLSQNKELAYRVPIAKWLHRYTPGYQYLKALEYGMESFKTDSETDWHQAVHVIDTLLEQKEFRQEKRALWYDKKALIYQMKFKDKHAVADVLVKALQDPTVLEHTKAPLEKRARRLAVMKNSRLEQQVCDRLLELSRENQLDLPCITIKGNAMENVQGRKATYRQMDSNGDYVYSSVEESACLHYRQNTCYTSGVHWEGRIITTIFSLIFWDIIYDPLDPGMCIFLSPYQEVPLDFYTDTFYTNRKALIQARLDRIKSGWADIEEIILFMGSNFNDRREGEVSLLSSVTSQNMSQVLEVARCLGRDGLHAICSRLAMDYHYYHSGFPDLTIWNGSHTKIKFVEVKGEGDTLSHKQIQWMKYLMECGIETEVCHVARTNKNKKKSLSPRKSLTNSPNKGKILVSSPKKENNLSDSPSKKNNVANSPNKDGKELKSLGACTSQDNSNSTIKILDVKTLNSKVIDSPKRHEITSQDFKMSSPKLTPQKRKFSETVADLNCSPGGVYVRTPNKNSRGVGYISSPEKKLNSPGSSSQNPSPSKKRISLSLTKRRLYDCDK